MFADRRDAGQKLGEVLSERLKLRSQSSPLVLGIPRGGVAVGIEVARKIDADFDVLLTRKIRSPNSPEFALGAVSESGAVFLDQSSITSSGASDRYLEKETEHQRDEIRRRRLLLAKLLPVQPLRNRTVIIVDDGIATGSTLLASLKAIKSMEPKEIIIAVPVAPFSAEKNFSLHCDDFVCLETPEPFYAVGQVYSSFGQLDDSVMLEMIRRLSS